MTGLEFVPIIFHEQIFSCKAQWQLLLIEPLYEGESVPSKRKTELFPTPLNIYLDETFKRRKSKNAKYSMRAFARDLRLPASKLSEILSGKGSPGAGLTKNLVSSLKLDTSEAKSLEKMIAKHRELQLKTRDAYVLAEDEYSLVAGLEHYGLIHLLGTVDCVHDARWLAARLDTSMEKVVLALGRMQRLELIKFVDGKIIPTHKKLTTTHDIPSQVLRESHLEVLRHAAESLEKCALEDRNVTSITFAVNKEKLSEAKELIKEFRRKIATLLSQGETSEVYNLNVQLVPLTYRQEERQ